MGLLRSLLELLELLGLGLLLLIEHTHVLQQAAKHRSAWRLLHLRSERLTRTATHHWRIRLHIDLRTERLAHAAVHPWWRTHNLRTKFKTTAGTHRHNLRAKRLTGRGRHTTTASRRTAVRQLNLRTERSAHTATHIRRWAHDLRAEFKTTTWARIKTAAHACRRALHLRAEHTHAKTEAAIRDASLSVGVVLEVALIVAQHGALLTVFFPVHLTALAAQVSQLLLNLL